MPVNKGIKQLHPLATAVLKQVFSKKVCAVRKNPYFCTPNPKGTGPVADSLEKATKNLKEKFGKSKSLRTFALPNRKKPLADNETDLTPTQDFILIENKIWKVKKSSYLCTPNHKQGLQTARKELETQLAMLR